MRSFLKYCVDRLFAALPAFISGLLFVWAPATFAADTKPDEVLVKLRTPAALGPIVTQFNVVQTTQFGTRPIYRLKLPLNTNVDNVVNQLTINFDVLLAEPNYTDQSPEARRNRSWIVGSATNYTAQWAPNAINLTQAHTMARGAGVRVAVLDTGVDSLHPALAGKLLPGYNFVDNNTNTSEVGTAANLGFGHGTHVAGLVALTAPDAKIVPYRVLDENGEGNVWVLAEALLRAIDPDGNPATDDGAHVINISLGTLNRTRVFSTIAKLASCHSSSPDDPTTDFSHSGFDDDRTRCANGKGVVIVVAAGNDGVNKAEYPAAEGIAGAISVGASERPAIGHLQQFRLGGGRNCAWRRHHELHTWRRLRSMEWNIDGRPHGGGRRSAPALSRAVVATKGSRATRHPQRRAVEWFESLTNRSSSRRDAMQHGRGR